MTAQARCYTLNYNNCEGSPTDTPTTTLDSTEVKTGLQIISSLEKCAQLRSKDSTDAIIWQQKFISDSTEKAVIMVAGAEKERLWNGYLLYERKAHKEAMLRQYLYLGISITTNIVLVAVLLKN